MKWAVPALAVSTTPPAFAASNTAGVYNTGWRIYGETRCDASTGTNWGYVGNLNDVGIQDAPQGFSVVDASENSDSPVTNATITNLQMIIALPENLINANYLANPFFFGANSNTMGDWELASSQRVWSNTLDTNLIEYRFDWVGATTSPTVEYGTPPESWPGSQFEMSFRRPPITNGYCPPGATAFFGGYSGDVSVESGTLLGGFDGAVYTEMH